MRRVLIVDDVKLIRNSIRDIVEKLCYEVIAEAENGETAVKMYKELRPDLVIMDITMPKMNGIEALKNIIKYDSDAKVVMVTAMTQQSMIRESVFNGAKYFLLKPFKEEYAMNMLKKVAEIA